jgi:replicative superfamily II helicase
MLDRFAKEKYEIAANLLDDIDGEDIRLLLLEVSIEASKKTFHREESELTENMNFDYKTLKKLAESLLFRVIFDKGLTSTQKESACLVCAYAFETLCPPLTEVIEDGMENLGFLNRVISSWLYYLAGYDPNAKTIANELESYASKVLHLNDLESIAIKQLYYFTNLKMTKVKVPIEPPKVLKVSGIDSLTEYCRQACFYHLINCLNDLSEEFCYVHQIWNTNIKVKLENLVINSRDCGQETITLLASLLLLFEELLKDRAISTLKSPDRCNLTEWGNQMNRYINEGIYFIWPPHKDAISKGLLDEKTNNIVAIPTGTGKSLIAEHKVIANLQTDTLIIYLAPTLALCRQINKNMKKILDIHQNGKGSSILIDDVNLFSEDSILESDEDMILVMTPEKCVTLIGTNPDLVKKCSLCIVDEFHSIFHGPRGALLDLLLSRISQLSETSFLFMSALIENSPEIESWAKKLNNNKLGITDSKWRPTRTLRGFVSHPKEEIIRAEKEAEDNGKKSYKTKLITDLYFCVQDVWSGNRRQAYPLHLPIKMEVKFKKVVDKYSGIEKWRVDGYGNDIARQLGNYLSSCNMPVLIFSQGTRHLLSEIDKHKKIQSFPQVLSEVTAAYLTLAKEELGYESELAAGLKNGIGIHTQALLEEEQRAVENFFKNSSQGVLCATGTVSQGLNLAAGSVIVNTTKQHQDEEAKALPKAEVINMLGRAGRPGFGLQSLGIIVPQYPSITTEGHFKLDQDSTAYLERVDGVEKTSSGLLNIIKEITIKEITDRGIEDNFTLITNVLGGSSAQLRKDMLSRTLATQFLEDETFNEVLNKWNNWLIREKSKEKELILQAAVRSANKASIIQSILKTINQKEIRSLIENNHNETIWIKWLLSCLQKLDTQFVIENIHDLFTSNTVMIKFLQGWLRGNSILDLAKILNNYNIGTLDLSNISRGDRTSIAKAIKIIKEGIRNISHIATAYLTILDLSKNADERVRVELPNNLLALPSYLKYGVSSEKAVVLRKHGFPRKICINLSEILPESSSVSSIIKKWKINGEINEIKLDKRIEKALLTILKENG